MRPNLSSQSIVVKCCIAMFCCTVNDLFLFAERVQQFKSRLEQEEIASKNIQRLPYV